jgi:hypothetical protein
MSNTYASITVQGFASAAEIHEVGEDKKRLIKFSVCTYNFVKGEEVKDSFSVELWNGQGDGLLSKLNGDLNSLRSAMIVLSGKLILKKHEGRVYPTIINPSIFNLTLKKVEESEKSEVPTEEVAQPIQEVPTEEATQATQEVPTEEATQPIEEKPKKTRKSKKAEASTEATEAPKAEEVCPF